MNELIAACIAIALVLVLCVAVICAYAGLWLWAAGLAAWEWWVNRKGRAI